MSLSFRVSHNATTKNLERKKPKPFRPLRCECLNTLMKASVACTNPSVLALPKHIFGPRSRREKTATTTRIRMPTRRRRPPLPPPPRPKKRTRWCPRPPRPPRPRTRSCLWSGCTGTPRRLAGRQRVTFRRREATARRWRACPAAAAEVSVLCTPRARWSWCCLSR